MSNLTYNQLIEQTRQFQKQAAVKLAEITGESVEDMPGSEHDGKVPASFLEPDPQVADGTMGPDSARSIDGAGDDRPITAGSLFESDESALNPEKKPMESSDWEAKSASAAMANDILSLVMGTKQASDSQTTTEEEPVKQAADKQAAPAEDELELTSDILCKIAASLLSTDEGVQIVQDHLEKTAGARDAEYIMNTLAEKSAEVQQGEQDAEYLIMKVAQAIAEEEAATAAAEEAAAEEAAADMEDISVDDVVEAVVELVEEGEISADEGTEILEAVGADTGVNDYKEDVDNLEDLDAKAADDPEQVEKAAEYLIMKMAQAVAAEEAAAEEAAAEAAAAEEDISTEELAQGIEEMLDSGELSEEDAQSLIVELMDKVPPEVAGEIENIISEEDAIDEEGTPIDPAAMGMTPEMTPKTASARDFSKFDALVHSLKNRLYR